MGHVEVFVWFVPGFWSGGLWWFLESVNVLKWGFVLWRWQRSTGHVKNYRLDRHPNCPWLFFVNDSLWSILRFTFVQLENSVSWSSDKPRNSWASWAVTVLNDGFPCYAAAYLTTSFPGLFWLFLNIVVLFRQVATGLFAARYKTIVLGHESEGSRK